MMYGQGILGGPVLGKGPPSPFLFCAVELLGMKNQTRENLSSVPQHEKVQGP